MAGTFRVTDCCEAVGMPDTYVYTGMFMDIRVSFYVSYPNDAHHAVHVYLNGWYFMTFDGVKLEHFENGNDVDLQVTKEGYLLMHLIMSREVWNRS